MNSYSKILIINFVIINVFALLFRPVFLSNMGLGLPIVLVITALIIFRIYRSLSEEFGEYKKASLVISIIGFFCLTVINLLVASGMAKVFATALG